MVKILSLKNLSGNPADGIDNINKAVFGRMDPARVIFFVSGAVTERGAIKQTFGSKFLFIWKNKPDILWGNGHVKELPLLIFRPRRTRYIINFHTILIKGKGPWTAKTPWFLRKYMFSRADLIICPSGFSAESVRRYFPQKRTVSILNGVDPELFNPEKKNSELLRIKYDVPIDKPLIVFVGTLQPRKRPDIFIEVAKRCPGANFIAVGRKFPEYDFLSSSERLENFKWVPSMPREGVAMLFASSSAFLFPSLSEPAAAVILEAMASGSVPVVSKSGGNSEFFRDGKDGFLVDPAGDEIAEFLKKIDLLIRDTATQKRFAESARREAERHSLDIVAESYFRAIEEFGHEA